MRINLIQFGYLLLLKLAEMGTGENADVASVLLQVFCEAAPGLNVACIKILSLVCRKNSSRWVGLLEWPLLMGLFDAQPVRSHQSGSAWVSDWWLERWFREVCLLCSAGLLPCLAFVSPDHSVEIKRVCWSVILCLCLNSVWNWGSPYANGTVYRADELKASLVWFCSLITYSIGMSAREGGLGCTSLNKDIWNSVPLEDRRKFADYKLWAHLVNINLQDVGNFSLGWKCSH